MQAVKQESKISQIDRPQSTMPIVQVHFQIETSTHVGVDQEMVEATSLQILAVEMGPPGDAATAEVTS